MRSITERRRYDFILSIYPSTKGFGFVLFEGPLSPIDWAAVEVPKNDRNQQCIVRITRLVERYQPEVMILQNMSLDNGGTRRTRRVRELNETINNIAEHDGRLVFTYSRQDVRKQFAAHGIPTKQLIAETIARHIPSLERHVPDARRPWTSERAGMAIFDAAALALTHFSVRSADTETLNG